ncbi:unnamed protein product [Cylicocyclus nassatus]|uniref:beta-N-acetylhexosaminidase n=1 Tax=Cylicocyclus nassatus TaxID=53992 RepID=A0AA36GN52_CYLNA|nr:unnamed protein product [Cylicocyclus nassatus]
MNTSAKNGFRRVACISALSGVIVFVLYSLRVDAGTYGSTEMSVPQSTGRPFDRRPFTQAIVHLDLKGAPPKVTVYEWLFPLLRKMGAHGVLIEYEDMFPYMQNLAVIKRADHYSKSDIAKINQLANRNFLEIIPLVQTWGHMEFILKHQPFFALRENVTADNTICPTDERSINLIRDMIVQVRALHPNSERIHIGGDEASHIAEDKRCKDRLAAETEPDNKRAVEKLKLAHIARVAQLARAAGYAEVFAWNDMFDKSLVEDIRSSGLGELITPVVWGYRVDVTAEGYFPDGLFDRISQIFPKIFFASAFKGAKSLAENYIDIERYLRTHDSYVKLYRMHSKTLDGRVGGIILTGWQRYMHHAPLCELLPISIPSLLTDLLYLQDVDISEDLLWKKVLSLLKCPSYMNPATTPAVVDTSTYLPHKDAYLKVCDFEGKELFRLIMEDLHMLEWKVSAFRYDPEKKAELVEEIQELAKKMQVELLKYYLPNDVNEFVTTKVLALKRLLAESFLLQSFCKSFCKQMRKSKVWSVRDLCVC